MPDYLRAESLHRAEVCLRGEAMAWRRAVVAHREGDVREYLRWAIAEAAWRRRAAHYNREARR